MICYCIGDFFKNVLGSWQVVFYLQSGRKLFLDLFLKYNFSSLVFICAIDLFSFLNADAVIT